MLWRSTRDGCPPTDFATALFQGLAPDEAFLDLKRKLMFDIYEANRQLQHIGNN